MTITSDRDRETQARRRPTQARRRPTLRRLMPRVLTHAVLLACSAAMLAPVAVMVSTSLKTNAEVYQNPVGLPVSPTLENYFVTWQVGNFTTLFANSLFLTLVTMTLSTLIAALAAYGIVRAATRVSAIVYLTIAVGIFLPMQLAIIPQFRLVRQLGLFNNYAGVILIYLAACVPFGVFLMTAFMRQVPRELVEAATIDGAGYFQIFWRIHFPLARPAIASFWILQGVQIWNDFLIPLLLMTSPERRTLTTGVMVFKQQYVADWGNVMAGVVIMSLPVVVLFLLLQRHFTSGLYAGAVK